MFRVRTLLRAKQHLCQKLAAPVQLWLVVRPPQPRRCGVHLGAPTRRFQDGSTACAVWSQCSPGATASRAHVSEPLSARDRTTSPGSRCSSGARTSPRGRPPAAPTRRSSRAPPWLRPRARARARAISSPTSLCGSGGRSGLGADVKDVAACARTHVTCMSYAHGTRHARG